MSNAATTAGLYAVSVVIAGAVSYLAIAQAVRQQRAGEHHAAQVLLGIFLSWFAGVVWVRAWYWVYYMYSSISGVNQFWMLGHDFPAYGLVLACVGGIGHLMWIGRRGLGGHLRRTIITTLIAIIAGALTALVVWPNFPS